MATQAPAERVRSILAVATSMLVRTADYRGTTFARPLADGAGDILLNLPDDDPLTLAIRTASSPAGTRATLECADVAPLSSRDRVRARVTGHGVVAEAPFDIVDPPGTTLLRFATERIILAEDGAEQPVLVTDFATASPDPLARVEADFLVHLANTHPAVVHRLAARLGNHTLHDAQRIQPLRVDRYGLVLRIEHRDDHTDVALPFAQPVTCPAQLTDAFRRLLDTTRRCHFPNHRR